jgi:CheY-like chemotaxis protein
VLLIDGDDDTRSMYSEYLKLGSWRIEEAGDGREALAKAIAVRPDVIVMETRLPGLDGYALCALLRKDRATAAIPIIIVTGDAFQKDVDRARAAGADAVMIKPCLPQALATEMQRLVEASLDRQKRGEAAHELTSGRSAGAEPLRARPAGSSRRAGERRVVPRGDTTTPPVPPPSLLCPSCDRLLLYRHSHTGGVSPRQVEQWDYYQCPGGCGTYQHRVRTRKLRKMP